MVLMKGFDFHEFMGIIYFSAFSSLIFQWRGLFGSNGLLPSDDFVHDVKSNYIFGLSQYHSFVKFPTFLIFCSDLGFSVESGCAALLLIGFSSATFICCGFTNIVFFILAWLSYLSLYLVGGTFLSFQWDILLLETGFLCIFSSTIIGNKLCNKSHINWCFRFLGWKLMFLAGVVKLQAKCPTWELLTALEYHFATQCLPSPVAWWAHQLPPIILRIFVAATLLIEIPFSFLLLMPFSIMRRCGAILQIILQISIIITGNYNFFNFLTIAIMMKVWENDNNGDLVYSSTNRSDGVIDDDFSFFVKLSEHFNLRKKRNKSKDSNLSSTSINNRISSISNHIDQQGPFVATAHLFRLIDDSSLGFYCQLISLLLFMSYCIMTMISVKVFDDSEDFKSFGSNIEIKWNVPYNDMEKFFPIVCPVTIGATCFFILCSTAVQVSRAMSPQNTPPTTTTTTTSYRINRIVIILGELLLGMIAITIIPISAGPLRSVTPIDHYLPAFTKQIEATMRPFHISSPYGLFRRMTGVESSGKRRFKKSLQYGGLPPSMVARPEVVLEGYDSIHLQWKEIMFRDKPTSLGCAPRYVIPHQPRLDWQMWFAALGTYHSQPWLIHLAYKLLKGDSPEVAALLDVDSASSSPPTRIRAWLYDYDFTRWNTSWARKIPTATILANPGNTTTASTSTSTRNWWSRRNKREYFPELDLSQPSLLGYLQANNIRVRDHIPIADQVKKCHSMRSDRFTTSWINEKVYAILQRLVCESLYLMEYEKELVTSGIFVILTSYLLRFYFK